MATRAALCTRLQLAGKDLGLNSRSVMIHNDVQALARLNHFLSITYL